MQYYKEEDKKLKKKQNLKMRTVQNTQQYQVNIRTKEHFGNLKVVTNFSKSNFTGLMAVTV